VKGARTSRFRDAHTHLSAGSADLHQLDLREVSTPEAIASAVAAAARLGAGGAWIHGWGWDGTSHPKDAAPDRPVFLARRDGHAAWINAKARSALGLKPDAAVVAEAAFDAARARLPQLSSGERIDALRPRLAELAASGVAAVDDMVERWGPEVYSVLAERRELPVAIGMWLPEDTPESEAEAVRRAFPTGDKTLATLGIKIFLDGALNARTAALSTPYADDPGNAGTLRIDPREIPERVARWAARGWPVALHAIGDRAVSLALAALERAPRTASGAHRIEHAQVVLRSDLPRFARAGILASVQPRHWRDDLPFLNARLGDRPDVLVHPLRSFGRLGVDVVFGSDWPVSSWDPQEVLAAAIDPARGEEASNPAQAAAWYTSEPR